MIRPSYWEPINRSCSRHYRRSLHFLASSSARRTSTCATSQSHVWISEEGLSQVFCRFLAQWQRTTSGNNNGSKNGGRCNREAYISQENARRNLVRGLPPIGSTSRSYLKLSSAAGTIYRARFRHFGMIRGISILSHQYFRPRIKRQLPPLSRTVGTLPRHTAAASAVMIKDEPSEAQGDIDDSRASPPGANQQHTIPRKLQKPKTWGAISSRLQQDGIIPRQPAGFESDTKASDTESYQGDAEPMVVSAPEIPISLQTPSNLVDSPNNTWDQSNTWSATTAQSINRAVSNTKPKKGEGYGLRQLLAVRGDGDLIGNVEKGFPLTSTNKNTDAVDFNLPDDKRQLVYTEAAGKKHAEAVIAQFVSLSSRQENGQEKVLEYKLSWASYPEALNTFVEYLHDTKDAKTDDITKQRHPSWDNFRSRLILGYWMLRLMVPYNASGLTAPNLRRFLAELMLARQWQTALWVLHEENVSDPEEVLRVAFKSTKELARHRKKNFSTKSRDRAMREHISSVVVKRVLESGTIEADPTFGTISEFRSKVSSLSTTKDLLVQWQKLKTALESPETILVAMPAIAAIVDRAVEMRLDKTNVWGRHQKQDLLFLCVELFLTLNEHQQAMLLKQLVSFLECWIDLGAAQADKRFKNDSNPENRTIPYLSAFVLFLNPTVRYEAVRVILQRVVVQEHNYANRNKQPLVVADQVRKSYGLKGMRGRNTMLVGNPQEDRVTKLIQPRPENNNNKTITSKAAEMEHQNPDTFSTALRRPWSMETLWPLLDIAKHEQTMASRSDTFPKAWRTRELAEILLEFKGRHAVATYLRESSDTEVLLFLVRAWLRRNDRYTELLNERKKNSGGVKVEMPCERKDFKEFVLDNILQEKMHNDTREEDSEVSPTVDFGEIYANAVFYLDSLGCPTTPLITEISYTLMSLRRTSTLISFEKLLQMPQLNNDNGKAIDNRSDDSKFAIPRQAMMALASYYTIHNPPSALYYLFRLPKMMRLYRNFIFLNAGSAHHLARRALLDFISPYTPSTTPKHRVAGGRSRGRKVSPAWEWWRRFPAAKRLKPAARTMLAAYARGIAVSDHLKPRQAVRRCMAAFTTGLRLKLGPDIRVAEALLFSVVVRRAQQELLRPMRSSLLPAKIFLKGFFKTKRVRYFINVLYRTAKREAQVLSKLPMASSYSVSYRNTIRNPAAMLSTTAGDGRISHVEAIRRREKRRRRVLDRAERFVSWLKEVVYVMKCQGGQLKKEDVRWMYTMSGDLNWQSGGVRFDEEDM